MDVAFYLGALAIHWYGILIALAVIAALSIAIIEAKRRGQELSTLYSTFRFTIIRTKYLINVQIVT